MNNERETDRLAFFSDAVIALAATLLVVELHPPRLEELTQTSLWQALTHQWSSYLAFAISFLFIGIVWAAHHDMFRYIKRSDHILLILNLLFLMGIALQSFSTALLAEYWGQPEARTATLVDRGILLFTSIFFNAVWWYAIARRRLVEDDAGEKTIRTLTKEHALAPLMHGLAFVVALGNVALSFIPLLVMYTFFAFPRTISGAFWQR